MIIHTHGGKAFAKLKVRTFNGIAGHFVVGEMADNATGKPNGSFGIVAKAANGTGFDSPQKAASVIGTLKRKSLVNVL